MKPGFNDNDEDDKKYPPQWGHNQSRLDLCQDMNNLNLNVDFYSDGDNDDDLCEPPAWKYNQGSNPTCATYATAYCVDQLLHQKPYYIRLDGDNLAQTVASLIMNQCAAFPDKVVGGINKNYKSIKFDDCDGNKQYAIKLACKRKLKDEVKQKKYHKIIEAVSTYQYRGIPIVGCYWTKGKKFMGQGHPYHAIAIRGTKQGKLDCYNSWGNEEVEPQVHPDHFDYFLEIKIAEVSIESEGTAGYDGALSKDDGDIEDGVYYICDESGTRACQARDESARELTKIVKSRFDINKLNQSQKFAFEADDEGFHTIQCVATYKYISAENKERLPVFLAE